MGKAFDRFDSANLNLLADLPRLESNVELKRLTASVNSLVELLALQADNERKTS